MARAPDARLAAIRSLFRYAALRHLDHAALNARVLAIPPQRFGRTLATFLTVPEISPLLGRNVEGDTIGAVVIRLTALLSFDGISTPSQPAQGEQRRSPNFKIQLSNPQTSSFAVPTICLGRAGDSRYTLWPNRGFDSEPSLRSSTIRLLVRNVSHLGIGQVASTALGILQTAVIGRALEPAQLGILYIVFAITSFVFVIADWGQSTYLVREMARGRSDEPELIGSALLIRLVAIVISSAAAVAIALALGYNGEIVALTLLAMLAAVPATLFMPFDCCFRGKDRMDIDAFANIVGKAMTLVATATALHFGGGLTEVILVQSIGGISTLLVGAIAARRLDIAVKAPAMKALRELVRHGAPIAAFTLVIALQPFVEILILSAFTGPAVVGWYGAYRSIFGIVISPATIVLAASFPELSRASLSLPDFRRMIDIIGRALFAVAAFTSSALYLFADQMVAIIYGHGRFDQTASILRVGATFIPLLFFALVLASAMTAVGRNKAMAVISIIRTTFCVVLSWLLIDYWQQRYGNGGIALVIIAGMAEIPATIACLMFLPRGAVPSTTTFNMVRACVASLCTVVPLSMLQPLGLIYLIPLFALLFAVTALVTRLVLPSDLRFAMEVARSRVLPPAPM